MDDEIGTNQRRRSSQNNNNNEEEEESLDLTLGPTSYPPQISPITTLLPPPDSISRPYFFTPSSSSSSLSFSPFPLSVNFFAPPPPPPPPMMIQTQARPIRSIADDQQPRRNSRNRNNEKIPAPFPWATNVRGIIQSLEDLESKQITTISGDVQCKHCEQVYQVRYNLRERFEQVEKIFMRMKRVMRERAPTIWTNPEATRCELCGREKAVKPVIADRKSQINWLFLLLGQTLGYCTLEQLKNFCKHSKSHRTGAKDRVLYLTYLGLCKMLQPNRDLFKRDSFRR